MSTGTLTVESSKKYQLHLKDIDVTSVGGPAFNLQSKKRVFITLAEGSVNALRDTAERLDGWTMKAALYGKGQMIFSGSGSLSVEAHDKHGIASSGDTRVREETPTADVTARDAIRTDNGFIFDDGQLALRGTGTTLDEESKGIKVDGTEGQDGIVNGSIVINGDTIDIHTVGKAITASWVVDEDAQTAELSDDPSPGVIVNHGIIRATTTGTPYERVVDGVEISLSPEVSKENLGSSSRWLHHFEHHRR